MRRSAITLLAILAACSGSAEETTTSAVDSTAVEAVTSTVGNLESGASAAALPPAIGADGNQVAVVEGPIANSPTRERVREARVVRVDLPTDAVVAITYDDGEVRLVELGGESKVRQTPGATGIVYTEGDAGVDILQLLPEQSANGRPAVLGDGQIAYVTMDGDLVLWGEGREVGRVAIDALPDGDVLVDGTGRLLVLTGPTDRYPHAILGDEFEASGFAIVEAPLLTVVAKMTVPEPRVIEGRRAIWSDFDGDGQLEVQITVSDSAGGAQLLLYEEDGSLSAEGAAIGRGSRWRHQVAFGNFGGRALGVEVVTPHIGGIVTFNEYSSEITRVARRSDFTSHAIGSRELEGAVALDIDADGNLELVVPTQDRRTLVAIGIVDGEAKVVWRSDLGGRVSSNIAVGTRNGVSTIAVGTANGTVYFWSAAP